MNENVLNTPFPALFLTYDLTSLDGQIENFADTASCILYLYKTASLISTPMPVYPFKN